MATDDVDDSQWEVKFREDEELEFFTELALHETERWICAVTKKSFAFPDDPRKSLENGILLCELLNSIKPGSVKRINKLSTPIAGLDNLHVFLRACKEHFGLNDTHLFDPSDLEDLSQRAIAESEHLKGEQDRRLRNVAVTVYWIGQVTASTYQGPKIDQSAFSALVHNQHRHREHIVADSLHHRDTSFSWESGSDCHSGSFGLPEGSNTARHVKHYELGSRHVRDGSYDSYSSYGKGSEDSVEEAAFEVDENGMPIPRYGSTSTLHHREGQEKASGRPDSTMYSSDKFGSVYRSSPDLSQRSNRRSSSTDSTEGSYYSGGHSRQSSDSADYPTRRSGQPSRKKSTSADPLQFIKVKGASDLALTAEEQMKLTAETKKLKFSGTLDDDNADWQSNLNMWKNRRKSHSDKSHLKEELEHMEKEKEEPKISSSQTTKTFSQMKEEREKRRSVSNKTFYPIEDEGEDDAFSANHTEQQRSNRTSGRIQSSDATKEDVKERKMTSRAKDNPADVHDEQEDEEKKADGSKSEASPAPEYHMSRLSRQRDNASDHQASRLSRDSDNTSTEHHVSRWSREGDSISEHYVSRRFREGDNISEHPVRRHSKDADTTSSESLASRPRREGGSISERLAARLSKGRESTSPEHQGRDTENTLVQPQKSSGSDQDSRDLWSKSCMDKDNAWKENNRNNANDIVTSGKVSRIRRSFQQNEDEGASDVKRVADLGDKKPHERFNARTTDTVSSLRSRSVDHGEIESQPVRSLRSRSKDHGKIESQAVSSLRSRSVDHGEIESQPVSSLRSRSIDHGEIKSQAVSSLRSRSKDHGEIESQTVHTSVKNSGKDYVEKTIKISQKPNSEKGFGFTLSGGTNKKQPVVVEKVSLGSAADVCELQAKDEVVAINGQSVAGLTSVELSQKVSEAVRVGQIELKVKRFLRSGDEELDEEDFLSTDEELDTPDRSLSKSSSVRAENSFDSLDFREDHQHKTEGQERHWINEDITSTIIKSQTANRRGDPTSTSSDSGYDAQTFSSSHREENSSNEEEIALPQHDNNQEETTPTHPDTNAERRPSRTSRTRHLYPRDEEEENYINLQNSNFSENISDDGRKGEFVPAKENQVESRSSITVRREIICVTQSTAVEGSDKHLAGIEAPHEEPSSQKAEEKNQDQITGSSNGGPPAVLRKWQKQRVRDDKYTFETDDSLKFYNQMKISPTSVLPRHSEKSADDVAEDDASFHKASRDYDETVRSQEPLASTRHTFHFREDRRRIRDWNLQQEEERKLVDPPVDQPVDQSSSNVSSQRPLEVTVSSDQRHSEEKKEQMQQQYQADLQRAAETAQQKEEQERQMLEPEVDKMQLLEERRARRRARLMQHSQDTEHTAPTSFSSSPPRATENNSQQQHTSSFATEIQRGRNINTAPQAEVLIIDPRNRGENAGQPIVIEQPDQPYKFQLKIKSRETPQGLLIQPQVIATQPLVSSQQDHAAFLEAERERIRQEELQKIEAERRQREEEERQQMRLKEEQLRQQAEALRQQEEELRRQQQQLELQRQQLQNQQQVPSSSPASSQRQNYPSSPDANHSSLQFETVTSRVRESSPVYTSTIIAGPRRSEGCPQTAGSFSNRQAETGSRSERNYGTKTSEPPFSTVRSENRSSWKGNVQPVATSHNNLPRWPPAGSEQGQGSNPQHQSTLAGHYSREDMLAMNRKATPLQSKPPPLSPTGSSSSDHTQSSGPIRREAHSKGQLHALNSVPKAKIRDSAQWIVDDPPNRGDSREQRSPAIRRSDAKVSDSYRNQGGELQDHWLIQEAERRRQAPAHVSGPIEAAEDSFGNSWRAGGSPNMRAQIRQTLLQRTAGARGSTGSNYSKDFNPPDTSADYGSRYPPTSGSKVRPPQPPVPAPEDRKENGFSVSGKQLCAHCNKELGFGAAMVIESLDLCYHTQCFKCYVCRTHLGSGAEGADVRVRVNKLHCPNCYSNDEAGLKFSKV